MNIELEQGFKRGASSNLPAVTSQMIFNFITESGKSGRRIDSNKKHSAEYKMDFVQVKKAGELIEARAMAFASPDAAINGEHFNVSVKVHSCEQIKEAACVQCSASKSTDVCQHVIAFIFWLHRHTESDSHGHKTFWGSEFETMPEHPIALRVHDIFAADELRMEADEGADDVNEEEGQIFLNNILDEMEKGGLTDSSLYKHCRPVIDEFEPVYIHHTMLDTAKNYIKDFKSFMVHMDEVAKQGLFDKLSDISIYSYKTPLWAETQFCRIRCSLIHRVATRKDSKEDQDILEAVFCKEREYNVEERRQLKQHKRFILKQTEKLENKTYRECGLLLNESYPYICASPDGITDDHIVEIKAPKTDEEFEKYLECKETIAPKYMAQIQIQMYMANVTKALYCVLSPTFDTNGALHYVWVQADMEFVASLLSAAEDYFKEVVFPRLIKIYIDCN
ncbi:uncharacterized protein LOC129949300 [Eupeodes corollae]|uniref:uncharacterized protein LOC129949300 n=1 Tax=Eupeodes corollae TaxID=290404 RepID=UPI00248FFEDD|nr:uncharacterized protein LOC129949300 [Eupeodes corollae]